MKWQKMCLDADLIDEPDPTTGKASGPLTSARVDLVFKKLCGNVQTMTFEQFMNGCVQVALCKYPHIPKAYEALSVLYTEHFSKFLNPHAELLSVFGSGGDSGDFSFFDAVKPVKEGILMLYQGYSCSLQVSWSFGSSSCRCRCLIDQIQHRPFSCMIHRDIQHEHEQHQTSFINHFYLVGGHPLKRGSVIPLTTSPSMILELMAASRRTTGIFARS